MNPEDGSRSLWIWRSKQRPTWLGNGEVCGVTLYSRVTLEGTAGQPGQAWYALSPIDHVVDAVFDNALVGQLMRFDCC